MEKTICELFAGVGGFRLGFDRLESGWRTVWFSQYEPSKKAQHAYECYVYHYGNSLDLNGECHTNDDIAVVDKKNIPSHTLLVGGFPCQDYSVAHWLNTAKGIQGKKGVLWWQIREILEKKNPPFCLFENVDRLIMSPIRQRGRDFAIMLSCLQKLNYSVEWRVVNSAKYGAAQRRRRTFIFAYKNDTEYAVSIQNQSPKTIVEHAGFMSQAFPIKSIKECSEITLPDDLVQISDSFTFKFLKAGYMHNGHVFCAEIEENEITPINIRSILQENVSREYYLTDDEIPKWEYMKGYKKIPRKSRDGHEYLFVEGAIDFPDSIDKPARTMLTNEATKQRTTHVIRDPQTNKLRFLTPLETERIQGFDDNWTETGMPKRARYFCMGNALVVPMITRMGKVLDDIISREK